MKFKINSIKASQDLTEAIDKLVETNQYSYIDAVIEYCEKNKVEVETIALLIKNSPKLKSKIQEYAQDMNLMKKKRRLPL